MIGVELDVEHGVAAMAAYDLYCVRSESLSNAASLVESLLSLKFEGRDSLYLGGDYYYSGNDEKEHLIIRSNFDPLDGEAAELDFPDCKILLHIRETERSEEILSTLRQRSDVITLLRHED